MTSETLAVAVAAKAMDGLLMRHAAIAQNIANMNSPRFQPVKVEFETALQQAARSGVDAVAALQFGFIAGDVVPFGEDRRMDLQLADAGQNATRFTALADMLGRRLAIEATLSGSQA